MTKEEIKNQIHSFAELMYKTGYEDGYKVIPSVYYDNYEKGLNDAWEAAKKIILSVNNGGLADDEIMTIFNKPFTGVLVENTAAEVVTKIKEYEEKQKARSCSYLEDVCPYDVKCEECEIHWSIERARKKLKESK